MRHREGRLYNRDMMLPKQFMLTAGLLDWGGFGVFQGDWWLVVGVGLFREMESENSDGLKINGHHNTWGTPYLIERTRNYDASFGEKGEMRVRIAIVGSNSRGNLADGKSFDNISADLLFKVEH
ncbi:unnamed protein product [Dovyalis caffra]|uniref:Uncharacterized protein n=1 Tax=Dovyalis caffra TaxID=77055 RepID=A0AAV1QZK6_9ROSI|nr:unnamed protein product [Dovyalis caffra]